MESTKQTLTRPQKEAVALLSIGTFLEYFDLMLYVHMAVLLNDLFFPPSDPFTASLYSAFAFCSVFVARPFGALIFGYIGDSVGRRPTIIVTTFLMAGCCFVMANLPTYDTIGGKATLLITICRLLQGISSMGEIIGAEIYLTETIKPPLQYPVVMLMAIACTIGGTVALGVAALVTSYGFSWRLGFWFGAGIALVGALARTTLRETVDFADAKRRLKLSIEKTKQDIKVSPTDPFYNEKPSSLRILAMFLTLCGYPVCFYFAYVHCGNCLKDTFGFTSEQIIHQNFIVSLVALFGYFVLLYLSYKVHPLKILQFKARVFLPFAIVLPYFLNHLTSPLQLLLIQSFFVLFILGNNPAVPIFYRYIPVFQRFKSGTMTYAISRALMHVVTSFGLIFLTKYLGHWGTLIITLPVVLGYAYGISHFKKLEIAAGNYH